MKSALMTLSIIPISTPPITRMIPWIGDSVQEEVNGPGTPDDACANYWKQRKQGGKTTPQKCVGDPQNPVKQASGELP